mmetsp:Transcript_86772/g.250683  ORF Transcript_86772/g.250683 Transcript_86772/m.250683 type:complete len:217 (-) Transcript_86772:197-847(-)|eukprot:CAMPEP_0176080800 /NCGR_PEP_ID=MMETSP0120_2-20121206/40417_1 /TAXON_ID=160619 /ORGANISM="Kryptoperidinium foliaceum, Strain CCMP 1326" /LENGTH=216 /DNA_ID=CAMNT_0017414567 /DNA_START=89 /DNA_END=739 /DNA_ORIENTATION=+
MDGAPDPTALIETAEDHKRRGNEFFKEGNYKRALGSYHKVFCYVNGLRIPGETSEADQYSSMMGGSKASQVPAEKVDMVKLLKQSTFLNMAACYLKVEEYRKCLDVCGKAMAAAGPAPKAYFRRGQAHLKLGSIDEAKADFEEAQRLEPNAAIEAELKKVAQAYAQHRQKEKKKFAGMFSKMSADTGEAPDDAPSAAGETDDGTGAPSDEAAAAAA